MSRSYRKFPVMGHTTAATEKQDKRLANRKGRRTTRIAVATGDEVIPIQRETSDVWNFDKDGKTMFKINSRTMKFMRK